MSRFPLDSSQCEALLARLPLGIVLSDENDKVAWVNAAFCEMLATSPESVLGAPVEAVLGADAEQVRDHIRRYVIVDDTGQSRWLECSATSLDGGDGPPATLRCFSDITSFDQRQSGRAATGSGTEPSRIDPESGLLNRQAVVQELNSQISRSRRYGNSLSLIQIVLDPDPEAEHDSAWQGPARRRVTEILKSVLRWADFVGALSADELLVILPETGVVSAREVIKKVKAAVADDTWEHTDVQVVPTFAATGWDEGDTMQSMFERLSLELRAGHEEQGD